MNNVFGEVEGILGNPIVRTGLKLAGPQASLIVDGVRALMLTFGGSHHKEYTAQDVLKLIDQRAAKLIERLATTKSQSMRKETEIRLHELLEIGQMWDRAT